MMEPAPGWMLHVTVDKQQRHERVQASLDDLKEGLISNIIMLLVTSPPPVQRALVAWDAPPEAGYI